MEGCLGSKIPANGKAGQPYTLVRSIQGVPSGISYLLHIQCVYCTLAVQNVSTTKPPTCLFVLAARCDATLQTLVMSILGVGRLTGQGSDAT